MAAAGRSAAAGARRPDRAPGPLEWRQRADPQLPARADPVAVTVRAVLQATHLRSEDLGQVLVLGQVREDPLGRLGEVVLDVDPVGAHREEPIRTARGTDTLAARAATRRTI